MWFPNLCFRTGRQKVYAPWRSHLCLCTSGGSTTATPSGATGGGRGWIRSSTRPGNPAPGARTQPKEQQKTKRKRSAEEPQGRRGMALLGARLRSFLINHLLLPTLREGRQQAGGIQKGTAERMKAPSVCAGKSGVEYSVPGLPGTPSYTGKRSHLRSACPSPLPVLATTSALPGRAQEEGKRTAVCSERLGRGSIPAQELQPRT